MRDTLRNSFEKFAETFNKLEQTDPVYVCKGLRDIKKCGRLILNSLLSTSEEDLEKLRRIERLTRDACPTNGAWLSSVELRAARLIEVHTEVGNGIPVEILPLFQYVDTEDQINPWDNVEALAKSLPGFVGVVKRRIGDCAPRLVEFGKLPLAIKLFLHHRTAGAQNVNQFFLDKTVFKCGCSWPDRSAPTRDEEFVKTLARCLWEPQKDIAANPQEYRDLIYHFHCHCETKAMDQHALILHDGKWGGRDRKVTLDSLRDALHQLRFTSSKADQPRPLVFLNACGSAHMNPAGATSFPEMFLEEGFQFLGVIGTEANVPAQFAREFAKRFYNRFCQGDNLGQALFAARWDMLRQFGNPLGILYTLYAEPELRIMPSV